MGGIPGRGFCVLVVPVGTLIVASFLVSWGCEVAFLPSLFSLSYFLGLSICCPLWVLSGPCCVLGGSGVLSQGAGYDVFGVCFLSLDETIR